MGRYKNANGRPKKGNQKPTFQVKTWRRSTDGPDCIKMVEDYGIGKCLPWQKLILNDWLARDHRGRIIATRCGLSVPRQNGKNFLLEARELYGLCILGESIIHSANTVQAAREAFTRLAAYFTDTDNHPDMVDMVVKNGIRWSNGQWSITLKNGGFIYFTARSQGTGRSMSCNLVVFDEAQALKDQHVNAILPVMSAAAGDRQMIFTGTPPDGEENKGDVFRRLYDEAHNDKDTTLTWHEWAITDVPIEDEDATRELINSTDNWAKYNPSFGYLISAEWTNEEIHSLSNLGALIERLGYWPEQKKFIVPAVDPAKWDVCRIEPEQVKHPHGAKTACGIRFSPDGRKAAIAFAETLYDKKSKRYGPAHIELAVYDDITNKGTSWIADIVANNASKVAMTYIDGMSNADDLMMKLYERKVTQKAFRRCTTNDATAAVSGLVNAVSERQITHIGQMQLDDSIRTSEKLKAGKSGAYTLTGEMPEPAQAAALALLAVKTTKRNPRKRQRIF